MKAKIKNFFCKVKYGQKSLEDYSPYICPGENIGVFCNFLLPGIFPTDLQIEPMSTLSSALQIDSLPAETSGKPKQKQNLFQKDTN